MATFSFGADPEFMLRRGDTYFSAIGVIPGTKDKRHKVGENSYYYDNVLAECTIKPANSEAEAEENIRTALATFAKLAKPYVLVPQASQKYPESELRHPDAIAIGCKREICAYALREVEPPEETMMTTPLRSAGGHVHVGHEFARTMNGCLTTIRLMDLFVGLPSVFLDNDPSTLERKKLYGQAGRFRKPSHGAEYRSMGNFWLATPMLTRLIYKLVSHTMDFIEAGRHEELWEIDEARLNDDKSWADEDFDPAQCHVCKGYDVESLRKAIDNMDRKEAAKFLPLLKKLLGRSLYAEYESVASRNVNGTDLYGAWGINV
jgi:hypothetical protein